MRTILYVVFLAVAVSAEAGQGAVTGVVRDELGGVVSGAAVVVRGATGGERRTVTGPEGRFSVEAPAGGGTLIVRAGGFAEARQAVSAGTAVDVVLRAASILESVTVTPGRTEQRLAEVPAAVSVIDREMIQRSPAVVADDVLRQAPTFSLFRRTSSLSSHPTAQGVSLRGIGPSGVSRTLVLYDGVPFNDPFGGWVYWTRVPLESVDRVEIVDSPSSNVYGNYAMGGIINVVGARPQPRTGELRLQHGTRNTPKADFFASDVWRDVGASVEGSFFHTDGFPIVREQERGPIDTKAALDYRNVNVKLDYTPNSMVSAFFRGGYFREERDNAKSSTFGPSGQVIAPAEGTPEANDTTWRALSAGVRLSLPAQNDVQARVFADFETFDSNFLAVPNAVTRTVGRVSLVQEVPTTGIGTIVQWLKPVSSKVIVSAGFDARHVEGESQEQTRDIATGTVPVLQRASGGEQISSGGYAQGQFWVLPNVSITASHRIDYWRNYNAHNFETTIATGLPTANSTTLPERDDTVHSDRLASLYQITPKVSVWGSIGTGFRAPTLNELYRQFRVGAVLTLANDQLGPERLKGGELGLNLTPVESVSVRSVWYDNRVENAVSNVTIATNTQQRRNLGRTRIAGWQNDVDFRLGTTWRVGAGYLYNKARVKENDTDPDLVGRFLPQVPVHRGSVHASYTNPRIASVSVNIMVFGRQFNEDTNTGTVPGRTEPGLPGYTNVELSASRTITRNVSVFLGVQNLFDEEYYVGLSPTTIGSPRLVNGGVRIRFSGR
jgi:outer membrane receptor protein involved in Fe transport